MSPRESHRQSVRSDGTGSAPSQHPTRTGAPRVRLSGRPRRFRRASHLIDRTHRRRPDTPHPAGGDPRSIATRLVDLGSPEARGLPEPPHVSYETSATGDTSPPQTHEPPGRARPHRNANGAPTSRGLRAARRSRATPTRCRPSAHRARSRPPPGSWRPGNASSPRRSPSPSNRGCPT